MPAVPAGATSDTKDRQVIECQEVTGYMTNPVFQWSRKDSHFHQVNLDFVHNNGMKEF